MKPGIGHDGKLIALHKRILVKVIIGAKTFRHEFVAPAQRGYSEAQIEKTIENVIDYLDKKFPTLEFRQVQLLPNVFTFIATGERQGAKNGKAEGKREDGQDIEECVCDPGAPDRPALPGPKDGGGS